MPNDVTFNEFYFIAAADKEHFITLSEIYVLRFLHLFS